MIGWFFLTRKGEDEIHYQGEVVEEVGPGYYMVQFFSWLSGAPTICRIVTIKQMHEHFYFTGKTPEDHRSYTDNKKKLDKIVIE